MMSIGGICGKILELEKIVRENEGQMQGSRNTHEKTILKGKEITVHF